VTRKTLTLACLLGALAPVAWPLTTFAQSTNAKAPDLVITSMAGRDLFEFYCAPCHGRDGKGEGHAAAALKVPPANLTTLSERNQGRFPTAKVEAAIKGEGTLSTPAHGSREMPVWGPIFRGLDKREAVNTARIQNIVKYIESLQTKARASR
jgi:mono/diheme cytochrome c family protein